MKKSQFDPIGTAALAGSIICWSMIPPLLKAFTPYLSGWETNAIRYPFAALLWLGPLLYQWRKGLVPSGVWVWALFPTAVNICAQALWAWLPYFLDATLIGFLVKMSVLFSIVGGLVVFSDERPIMAKPAFWFGTIFCVIGFTVMSWGGRQLSNHKAGALGIGLVLLCGMFYGLYGVSVRLSMRGARPWVAFPVISIYTSLALLILMAGFGEPERIQNLSPKWLGLVCLSSLIGIASAHTFFYISIERLGVAISGGMQLMSSFGTALLSYLLLGETMNWIQWTGGLILLVGGGLLLSVQSRLSPESMDPKKAPIEPRVPD